MLIFVARELTSSALIEQVSMKTSSSTSWDQSFVAVGWNFSSPFATMKTTHELTPKGFFVFLEKKRRRTPWLVAAMPA